MVLNQDAKHPLTHRESNAKYVARGAAQVLQYDRQWDLDVAEMNRGKVGRPYKYSDSMMSSIAILKTLTNNPYRQCSGYLEANWGGDRAPSHPTLWTRIGNSMPTFETQTIAYRTGCCVWPPMRPA